MARFRDSEHERYLSSMTEQVLVLCPRCGGQATVFREGRKLACGRCCHTRQGAGDAPVVPNAQPYDPFLGLGLWLQTPCAGEVLWAYNAEHLAFLRRYVAASLRERAPDENASLASRLPEWMKLARNRRAVLRGISRLELQLAR